LMCWGTGKSTWLDSRREKRNNAIAAGWVAQI